MGHPPGSGTSEGIRWAARRATLSTAIPRLWSDWSFFSFSQRAAWLTRHCFVAAGCVRSSGRRVRSHNDFAGRDYRVGAWVASRSERRRRSNVSAMWVLQSQQAVGLAVLLILAAHVVALGRHAATWIDALWRNQLIALLGILAMVALAAQILIRISQGVCCRPGQGVGTGWHLRLESSPQSVLFVRVACRL